MKKLSSHREIESWTDTDWAQICGNREVKNHLSAMARYIVSSEAGSGLNTLVLGPSRTGKTSAVDLFARTICCADLDLPALRPCGKCEPCSMFAARRFGVERPAYSNKCNRKRLMVNFLDGNSCQPVDLETACNNAAGRSDSHWFFCLDEVQGVVRRHLDHSLLKVTEQYAHITWIVSTATTKGLDPMFRNRFTEVVTERPTVDELALFLTERCRLPEIDIELDHEDTPILLAERSNRVVGRALQCLAGVKMRGGVLTRKLVEDYPFDRIDLPAP